MVNPNLHIFFPLTDHLFSSVRVNGLLRKAPVHCHTEISLIISEQIIEQEKKNLTKG